MVKTTFTPILIPNENTCELGNNVNSTSKKLKNMIFGLFMFRQKTLKSGRKTIHYEPVHVGKRNLTLAVRIEPGTQQASSLVKMLTPSGSISLSYMNTHGGLL